MDPTEPRRSPGLAKLGAVLVLGAANRAVKHLTDERPDPPPPPPRRHSLRWIGLALVVALVAAGTGVAVARRDDGGGAPKAWDPRIADLARFVERERDLRWEHPVRADFLGDRAFRQRVTGGDETTAEDRATLHHYEGLFRALGLLSGDVDLAAASKQLAGEGVIGLYVPEEDRIFVRGDTITASMRPTIVHELTHALQAQHFDLERETHTSGEDTAFVSLVEADAMRIEDAYVASLPEAQRDAIADADAEQADDLDLDGVPEILTELFSLPYVFGPTFVRAVADDGGNAAVDRAFRHPPTTEEHIIDPQSYLDGDLPTKVAAPRLRKGEKAVGTADDFGMLSLLLVLGERLPFASAFAAVEGWEGDASRDFRKGGRDCIRVRTKVESPEQATTLLGAVRVWSEGRDLAESEQDGDVVTFAACDPGTDVAAAGPRQPRTFVVLVLRQEILASLQQAGLDGADAVCVADDVLRDHAAADLIEVERISDPEDERIVRLQNDVAESVQGCRTTA